MSLLSKGRSNKVLNSSKINYDKIKTHSYKSININLSNICISNIKYNRIKTANTNSFPNLIKRYENGLNQINDDEKSFISNMQKKVDNFYSKKFYLFSDNKNFREKSNDYNNSYFYAQHYNNLFGSNNNSIKNSNDLTFINIPNQNNNIINVYHNNNFMTYLKNKINLPKTTLSVTANDINSVNNNKNNISISSDNKKYKFINLNLNHYKSQLGKYKLLSLNNLSNLDTVRKTSNIESLFLKNNSKSKNINSGINKYIRSKSSAINQIKNKIIKMEQQFSLKIHKNNLINRPPRTLNSQLFQFNKNEYKLLSPTLKLLKSSKKRKNIQKDGINNNIYKKKSYNLNNKKNIDKNFKENNNFKNVFTEKSVTLKLRTLLGINKKKNVLNKTLIENQRINKIKYEKINKISKKIN